MATIRIKRNDTWSVALNVIDNAGDAIDCTGWTIYFTVRSAIPTTLTSDDNDATISKEITGLASGEHTLTLTSDNTNIAPDNYTFDIQYIDAAGEIHSSETGIFVIQADITRSK